MDFKAVSGGIGRRYERLQVDRESVNSDAPYPRLEHVERQTYPVAWRMSLIVLCWVSQISGISIMQGDYTSKNYYANSVYSANPCLTALNGEYK